MPIRKTPSYPNRRAVLKGIVKTRRTTLNGKGNQKEKLTHLYTAELELLKENQIKLKNLIKRQQIKKANIQRLEKLEYAQKETIQKIQDIHKLINGLK
ncbi:MAG: hypothetical protein PHX27_03770 [Candidatus ainarchaeum sp.]|nr:hypothetical protein [Candidatus ainarchaeum sp.]